MSEQIDIEAEIIMNLAKKASLFYSELIKHGSDIELARQLTAVYVDSQVAKSL